MIRLLVVGLLTILAGGVAVYAFTSCSPSAPLPTEAETAAFVVESALATIIAQQSTSEPVSAPEPIPEPTEPVADAPALPEPTYMGFPDPDAVCERGPTGVSAEPEVTRAAPPGSLLNYTTVAYLQYAAKLNRWATEDCARSTGEPLAYYNLHLRSVAELELYGKLARNSANLKHEKIQAAWAAYVPTPEQGWCKYNQPILSYPVGEDGYRHISWREIEREPCRDGDDPGTYARPEDMPAEWRQYSGVAPTKIPPPMCTVHTAKLENRYGARFGTKPYLLWAYRRQPCEPGQPEGSVVRDIPAEWEQYVDNPRPTRRPDPDDY